MKKKVIAAGLLTCLISLMISCSPKKEVVVDKELIKKEIQAKEDEFASVFNSGTTKSIGYYADDAVSFSQNKPALVGKAAIVEYYQANLDSLSQNKISFTTNEIFVQNDGSLVVEIGYYKVVDSTDAVINSGNYISIFEKREGRYVCIRDMSTSDLPL